MRILDSVALIRESLKISMNIFYKVKKVHVLGRLQADSSFELKIEVTAKFHQNLIWRFF